MNYEKLEREILENLKCYVKLDFEIRENEKTVLVITCKSN